MKLPLSAPAGVERGLGGEGGNYKKKYYNKLPASPKKLEERPSKKKRPNETQSACLRKKAGISKSSIPPEANASTLAAACVRSRLRQTLGGSIEP